MTALALGLIAPITDSQIQFLNCVNGNRQPVSEFERLWQKLIHERKRENEGYELSPDDAPRLTLKIKTTSRDPEEASYRPESPDPAELLSAESEPESKFGSRSRFVTYVQIRGEVQRFTEKAILFDIEAWGEEWIPRSHIQGRVTRSSDSVMVASWFIKKSGWKL